MDHSKLCTGFVDHMKQMEPRRHEIPEITDENGKPTIVFSKPMKPADHAALAKHEKGKVYDVHLIVRKCVLEDGTPAFNSADALTLISEGSADLIGRLALDVYTYKGPKAAEIKN